jgi:DNA-binding MltR family transcriptional regulator
MGKALFKAKKKPITTEIKPATFVSLLKESDKGCVLLVNSMAEELLLEIHQSFVLTNHVELGFTGGHFKKLLVDGRGPLSDFNGRINLAFALKLISHDLYQALHLMRALRNEAAHQPFDFGLSDAGVQDYLKDLKLVPSTFPYADAFEELKQSKQYSLNTKQKLDFVAKTYLVVTELRSVLIDQIVRLEERRRRVAIEEDRKKTSPEHSK